MTNTSELFDKLEDMFISYHEVRSEQEEDDMKVKILTLLELVQLRAYSEGMMKGKDSAMEIIKEILSAK